MRNKYFSYSFQISNTKKIIILFLILVLIAGIGYLVFIHGKTKKESLEALKYQKVLGMETFEDTTCDQAYRIYYDKKTCGTICMNVSTKNTTYLEDVETEMKENGFTTTGIKSKKIHRREWEYFQTKNTGSVFSYYAIEYNEKLYSVELINQSSSFSKEIKTKCDNNFNKILSSLELK